MVDIPANDSRAVALVAAIQSGDTDTLQSMLKEDPDLATSRIVDDRRTKRTTLHIVTDWPGHFPNGAGTAAALIQAGADVNARVTPAEPGGLAETPLHWAASSDDVPLIDALLDAGADIETPGAVFTGGSPMSDAVVFAQWNAARRLLERGAQTTIWQAAALGLLDRVQEHFASETPPSEHEVTNAFWNACRGGQRQVAEYLLGRGADLNWIGHDHKTPLQVAHESGVEDLIAWLRTQGAME
jgi:ankyrin repeat protein